MSVVPTLYYDPVLEPRNVRAALVWGLNMPSCARTESAPQYLSELLDSVRIAGETFISPARKSAVRAMLRFRNYKPAGRSKPSSEYLLAVALQNDFPLVNGPVDVNNVASLKWGYPASIFDINLCGTELLLRRGLPGESYIFNPSGQSIDLEDLLCVCRKDGETWQPCGNPVKDAMATKIGEFTRGVAAVIYAPLADPKEDVESAAACFAALLHFQCGASESGWVLP
jgi:DNA/RNA-binding domain of Phe-tRNA-synthetase-like protein